MKRSLQLNPDNQPATWEQIRNLRDQNELAPVNTSFGIFDCDERSDARMQEAMEQFHNLPTVVDGVLQWKRADNTFIGLTLTQLQEVQAEIKTARAVRAAQLHAKAEAFNQQDPRPTPAQLQSLDFWLN